MLEDFIEANNLSARFVGSAPKESIAKCKLFLADNEPVLTVFLIKEKLDLKKIKSFLNTEKIETVPEKQVEEITGYSENFLPPVSIYGVKVLIDKKVLEKEKVFFKVSEKEFLEIPTEEILNFNEEAQACNLT